MSNNDNLQPFTKNNAKYYGKRGGIKSGQVRAERKSLKEQMKLLLEMPVSNDKRKKELIEAGFDEKEINNQLYLTHQIFEKAISGDLKATTLVFNIIQKEDIEKENNKNDSINDMFIIWSENKARE